MKYVLLQKSNYECVKSYGDSMPERISQKPLGRAEAYGLPTPKSFQSWKPDDNEI